MGKRLSINGCCLLLFALLSCARRDRQGPASDEVEGKKAPARPSLPPTKQPSPPAPTRAKEADPLAVRKALWQKKLDGGRFVFHDAVASAADSLARYKGKPMIEVVEDESRTRSSTSPAVQLLRREQGPLIQLSGHSGSVFRVENKVLYFADFPRHSTGCTVTAHDLATGKELWKTRLNALRVMGHSRYSNSVTMEVSKPEGAGVVIIYGKESSGTYLEVLDQKTGQVLAHRGDNRSF
jgi:hypothetical protein